MPYKIPGLTLELFTMYAETLLIYKMTTVYFKMINGNKKQRQTEGEEKTRNTKLIKYIVVKE